MSKLPARTDESSPAADQAATTRRAGLLRRLRLLVPPAWVGRVALVYLVARLVGVILVYTQGDSLELSVVGVSGAWDGTYHRQIVEGGYPSELAQQHAFLPLYPLLAAFLGQLLGSVAGGLLGLSVLSGLTATLLVWMLTRRVVLDRELRAVATPDPDPGPDLTPPRRLLRRLGTAITPSVVPPLPEVVPPDIRARAEAAADRAATLFACFPGAYVFALAYSEGLALTFAAGSLLALLGRRWVLAGLLAALATATRPNMLALIPALSWVAAWAVLRGRDWRALLAPALAPVGLGAYLLFLQVHTGSWTTWRDAQSAFWRQELDFSRKFVTGGLLELPTHLADRHWPALLPVLGVLLLSVGVAALLWWRPPAPLVIYTAGVLLFSLAYSTVGTRPRFVLTAFPLVMAVAVWAGGRRFAPVTDRCGDPVVPGQRGCHRRKGNPVTDSMIQKTPGREARETPAFRRGEEARDVTT